MNLSDKIDGYDGITQLVVRHDIKESIKELNEWGNNNLGCIDSCNECDLCKQHLDFNKEINKIFGDKLI